MLSGVPTALSAHLFELFEVARVHELKAGGVLFAAGDIGDSCYRLDKGLLKVMVTSTTGEERIVAILGPGAIVGELAMIDRMPRSASVLALRDSVLRFISREAYEKRVLARPETKQALLEILAFRLRQADEELVATTFLSGKARLARALLELANSLESLLARNASCSTRRSAPSIWRRWLAWRGKTPAAC